MKNFDDLSPSNLHLDLSDSDPSPITGAGKHDGQFFKLGLIVLVEPILHRTIDVNDGHYLSFGEAEFQMRLERY